MVELPLKLCELVAYVCEGGDDIGSALSTFLIGIHHLAGCRELKAALLDKVVDDGNLVDVFLGVLPHVLTDGLGLEVWKLSFPVAQCALVEIEHFGYFSDAVIEFYVFVGV